MSTRDNGTDVGALVVVIGAGAGTAIGIPISIAAENFVFMLVGTVLGVLIGSVGALILKESTEK